MPSKTTDYTNGKIFQLKHTENGVLFIGSTTTSIDKCFISHKKNSQRKKLLPTALYAPMYKWIEENGGWNKIYCELIEDYPCQNNKDLRARVHYWINEVKPLSIEIHKDKAVVKNKYQNGKIYKFVKDGDVIYVGSTKNALKQRLSTHKYMSKKENPQKKVYKYINENGGWDNIKMELIEEYPCDSKQELEKRERYWIEELKPITNIIIPLRTKKEWKQLPYAKEKEKEYRIRNQDKLKVKAKKYREENKEAVSEGKKSWYQQNKEKVKERMARNYAAKREEKLAYQKQYAEQKKDHIAEKQKEYRKKNAETLSKKKKEYRDNRTEEEKAKIKQYMKEYHAKRKAQDA